MLPTKSYIFVAKGDGTGGKVGIYAYVSGALN